MKTLLLTRGRVALVDDADFEMVSHWKWSWEGRYAIRRETSGGRPRVCYLHRMLMLPGPGELVDHINGDKLDNRRCNLRIATKQQNARNGRSHAGSTSAFKGVSWDGRSGSWRATITTSPGTLIDLGHFADEQSAARAYDDAASRCFGEFALPNFAEVSA